jgi:hypothetical protein
MLQHLSVSLTVSPVHTRPAPRGIQRGGYPIEKDVSGWYAVIYDDWSPSMIYKDLFTRVKQLSREYDDALYEEEYGLEEELGLTLGVLYREYNEVEYLLSGEQVSHIESLLNEAMSAKVTFQVAKSIATKEW